MLQLKHTTSLFQGKSATSGDYFSFLATYLGSWCYWLPSALNRSFFINDNHDQTSYLDRYSKSGPNFSKENGPGGPLFLEFGSPRPLFSPDQNFRDSSYMTAVTVVEIWSLLPCQHCREVAKCMQFIILMSMKVQGLCGRRCTGQLLSFLADQLTLAGRKIGSQSIKSVEMAKLHVSKCWTADPFHLKWEHTSAFCTRSLPDLPKRSNDYESSQWYSTSCRSSWPNTINLQDLEIHA